MQIKKEMIHFRRVRLDDLSQIYDWLTNDPEVKRFWGYAHQGPYEEVTREFERYVNGDEPTEPYLILYGETSIGYIQTFQWIDYPEYEQYVDLSHAASIDLFIGLSEFRNKGLGSSIISRFLRDYVFADPSVVRCVINPEVSNSAAIRVYEKVGYRIIKTVQDISGEPGPVHFMSIERDPFISNNDE
ncbi:GNAT family N-acetyltransferase [Paenibacillus spongiae]|uniref:Acetyltransferase n=1 Tax=Paenibacillus spongiae TaxID=2909671 RepID=A0ABY5S335_9BACL|nr:GNAT family N-acetyltransferase [Paenibacillus spongiae]UVI28314.1 acetyltransferase [Paenibacillus spongiae]